MKIIRSFFRCLIDFLYPPFCSQCNQPLKSNEKIICDECWSTLEFIQEPYCHQCGAIPEDDKCKPGDFKFSQARSLAKFHQEVLKDGIHLLKYERKRYLGIYLGKKLGQVLAQEENYKQVDFIVPVPLHSSRFRERGYNQSTLISQGISAILGAKVVDDELIRTKHTVSQTTLSLQERKENVSRAFRLKNPQKFSGKIILLVDDVFTTGATLNSCSEPFLDANIQKVLVATVGRA